MPTPAAFAPSKTMTCRRGCGASALVSPETDSYLCPRCESGTDSYRDRKPWQERTANDAPAQLQGEEALAWANGYNSAVECLGDMYVVAWSGGYESPSFFSSRSRTEAQAKFDEWVTDCKPGDRVDMIAVSLDGSKTTELATGPVEDDENDEGLGF